VLLSVGRFGLLAFPLFFALAAVAAQRRCTLNVVWPSSTPRGRDDV
jgi:hypothetical protein